MAKLTIPISETTEEKFLESIHKAAAQKPDMLELRTDCLHNLNYDTLEKLIKTARSYSMPVIVTCRDPKEGGMHNHSQLVRLEILCEAVRLNADYIDCEYHNYQNTKIRELISKALEQNHRCRLILSAHNFEEPFYELPAMYDNMHHANRTAVIKMAYKANNINDCFAAFDLLKARKSDLVMACMGSGGEITRILAPKFGNFITFASLDELSCSAPGQLTLAQMRKLYRFDEINADTELYGIIADPVGHSASPAVYNASFDKGGGNAVYLPLLTEGGKEGFDMFMENVLKRPWMDFRGFSVTIPHKNNAFEYVRKRGTVDAKALPIGAINTVAIDRNGEISGYNTDYAGALNPLKKALGSLRGRKVAIIGAGGVSKAVAAGLTAENADVTIFNRTVEKAKHLAETFGCKHDSIMNITRLGRENFEVVVNCTSIGMSPHVDASPVEIEQLDNRMTVFDTVYNPLETTLLKFARKAGAATITGFEMFVEQALEQYRLLTGKDADQKLIRTVLEEKLLKKDGNGQ